MTSKSTPESTEAGLKKSTTARRADLTALLGAFCFFLSAVEYMIPKPLPFMRLGIANLPILLAVDLLPLPWYLVLALVKVVGMSVISGSLFSYVALFSLAGTLVAAAVMWTAKKAGGKAISAVGVSILGAVASNAVQIVIARVLIFGEAARLIAPVFLLMGLITGAILGLFTERFSATSKWYRIAKGDPRGCYATATGSVTGGTANIPSTEGYATADTTEGSGAGLTGSSACGGTANIPSTEGCAIANGDVTGGNANGDADGEAHHV
jgi:heptaprenyl diphosphate synthase